MFFKKVELECNQRHLYCHYSLCSCQYNGFRCTLWCWGSCPPWCSLEMLLKERTRKPECSYRQSASQTRSRCFSWSNMYRKRYTEELLRLVFIHISDIITQLKQNHTQYVHVYCDWRCSWLKKSFHSTAAQSIWDLMFCVTNLGRKSIVHVFTNYNYTSRKSEGSVRFFSSWSVKESQESWKV